MSPNRLHHEKSPYLLQHAHNPVDWYPWGEEAFAAARRRDCPVFLSVGYATCHWCHVMERESFEDAEMARALNAAFVCIKVDREERPDVDAVYMSVCQMLTGGGGWPLTVIMTPDRQPFFAGTYLPKRSRFGRAGLMDVCGQVNAMWRSERGRILSAAGGIQGHLVNAFTTSPASAAPDLRVLDQAQAQIARSFDPEHGGFGPAPKFPTPHRLWFLMRHHHHTGRQGPRQMVVKTLTAMRMGGLWDHIGFGFHRYSTDTRWLLPHFEKMLYDQALLAIAYLEAHQLTGEALFARTAREIFAYVAERLTAPEGAFFTAEDADSEGEEGRFYVWSQDELGRILGAETAATWARILSFQAEGNFLEEATRQRTGANIPHLTRPLDTWAKTLDRDPAALEAEWVAVRRRLAEIRAQRVRPLRDDKVLTDWNGLMIAALSVGARVLDRDVFADSARRAVDFIEGRLTRPDGRLLHRYRDGEAGVNAHAGDYAGFIWGLIELYRTTFDTRLLARAVALQDRMTADFWDAENDGYFLTDNAAGDLPVRPKELADGAIPSANALALTNLLLLGRLTGDARHEERAQQLALAFGGSVRSQPVAYCHFLNGLDLALRPGRDLVVSGSPEDPDTGRMMAAVQALYAPNLVAQLKSDENADRLSRLARFTAGLAPSDGAATAHLCVGGACDESVTDVAEMLRKLTPK
jgi:uncharacterized protein YyaL (SSP411 family)